MQKESVDKNPDYGYNPAEYYEEDTEVKDANNYYGYSVDDPEYVDAVLDANVEYGNSIDEEEKGESLGKWRRAFDCYQIRIHFKREMLARPLQSADLN